MKAWKNGAWSLSGQAIRIVFTLGILAVLGRLLTPEQFGVFGLILAIQAIIQPVLDMGLQPVYVKLDKVDKNASDVFFTINLLVGCFMALLLVILAPCLASYYDAAILIYLLPLFSFSIIFTTLGGQPQAVLSRAKRFDKIIKVQTVSMFMGGALVIVLALLGFGVWSLVWRAVFEGLFKCVLMVFASQKRYKLATIAGIKTHLGNLKFGLEIVAARLLSGWVSAIDKLVLGKFASLELLGGYTRAQQFALMPNGNISAALTTPALSYLSRSREDTKLDDHVMLNWIVFLFAGTPCLLLITHGDLLFPILLGEQWAKMGWILQWMGLLGIARVFQGLFLIYNIDHRNMRRTNHYILGALVGVLAPPIIIIGISGSPHMFVITYSITAFVYWFFVSNYAMAKDYPEQGWVTASQAGYQMVIAAMAVGAGLFLKEALHGLAESPRVLVIMFFQLIIIFSIFALLKHKMIYRIYQMVKIK